MSVTKSLDDLGALRPLPRAGAAQDEDHVGLGHLLIGGGECCDSGEWQSTTDEDEGAMPQTTAAAAAADDGGRGGKSCCCLLRRSAEEKAGETGEQHQTGKWEDKEGTEDTRKTVSNNCQAKNMGLLFLK